MTLVSDLQSLRRASSSMASLPTLSCPPQIPEIAYKPESRINLEEADGGTTNSICVEILEHRSVGRDRRSQVVGAGLLRGCLRGGAARRSTLSADSRIVAKFYDPRYANAPQEWAG